jgi:protein-disulfide isomerase
VPLRLAAFAAFLIPLVAAACAPSPERLQETLVKHPEIVIAAIQAHPAQFLEVLNQAARAAQEHANSRAVAEDSARIEREFLEPRVPDIAPGRAVLGNPRAAVTIVEYGDFECPYCRQAHAITARLLRKYGDRLRLVLKQTPMDFHPHALPAALMYEAIARQNPAMAYRFYDEVFEHQERLESEGSAYVEAAARSVGADMAQARRDATSPVVRAIVDADMAEAHGFGFDATPGFLINGVSLHGLYPQEQFERIIDRHLAGSTSR